MRNSPMSTLARATVSQVHTRHVTPSGGYCNYYFVNSEPDDSDPDFSPGWLSRVTRIFPDRFFFLFFKWWQPMLSDLHLRELDRSLQFPCGSEKFRVWFGLGV